MVKVAVATLGCKVNQCESAGSRRRSSPDGITLVPFEEEADCYIINTCTVTGRTDCQSRQLIRRAIRRNPAAAVLVTGCYAQSPGGDRPIRGVRVVAGNAGKERIPRSHRGDGRRSAGLVGDIRKEGGISRLGATHFPEHTRAFLKIQDGCDAFCSYCIVPHVRGEAGASRSGGHGKDLFDLPDRLPGDGPYGDPSPAPGAAIFNLGRICGRRPADRGRVRRGAPPPEFNRSRAK